jgi:hypothetical protein
LSDLLESTVVLLMAKRCFDELNTASFPDSTFVKWVYVMEHPAAWDKAFGPPLSLGYSASQIIGVLYLNSNHRLHVWFAFWDYC